MHFLLTISFTAWASLTSALPWLPWFHKRDVTTVPQYVLDYGSKFIEKRIKASFLDFNRNSTGILKPKRQKFASKHPKNTGEAPVVWLYSTDDYRPADIGSQLTYTHPTVNETTNITDAPSPLTLNNLNSLNDLGGTSVYLASNDDFTQLPSWLDGTTVNNTESRSCAIIINDKGTGEVDAFFIYFYAYNQGNSILGEQFGDHVGDWEHNMVRFENGVPTAIWYSQHSFGEAFTYAAVEKDGNRPISYSANGTHANWATVGKHDHVIAGVPETFGPLQDTTDQGELWDPLLTAYFFSVTYPAGSNATDDSDPTFTGLANPANSEMPPVNWLYFEGQWGDEQLSDNDPRQFSIFGQDKYTSGPNGPRYKGLRRTDVCLPDPSGDDVPCVVQTSLPPGA